MGVAVNVSSAGVEKTLTVTLARSSVLRSSPRFSKKRETGSQSTVDSVAVAFAFLLVNVVISRERCRRW